jgi:hypothetical protein
MNAMLDMTKYGKCIGALHYGTVVQLWFESLDGDASDSRQLNVVFDSEEQAAAVAAAAAYRGGYFDVR